MSLTELFGVYKIEMVTSASRHAKRGLLWVSHTKTRVCNLPKKCKQNTLQVFGQTLSLCIWMACHSCTRLIHWTRFMPQRKSIEENIWRSDRRVLGKRQWIKVAKFMVALSHSKGVLVCELCNKMDGNNLASFIYQYFNTMFERSCKGLSQLWLQDGDPSLVSARRWLFNLLVLCLVRLEIYYYSHLIFSCQQSSADSQV